MKVIFKVAEPRDQDATAMRPESKGPSVNVARRRLPEATEEADASGYRDIVRPIEDVRSFQHQVTKGRHDRWAQSCIVLPEWVVRRELRLQARDLIHIKWWKQLWEPARKIYWLKGFFIMAWSYCIEMSMVPAPHICFLLIFFIEFDNIFINSEIRRMWSNKRPPPWRGTQPDFNHYQWYYSYYVWWQPQDTCNSVTVILVP